MGYKKTQNLKQILVRVKTPKTPSENPHNVTCKSSNLVYCITINMHQVQNAICRSNKILDIFKGVSSAALGIKHRIN